MLEENTTSDLESVTVGENEREMLVKYSIYVVEGLFLAVGNFLILAAVARHKIINTQKEYIVMAGLALTDFFSGVATFLAGVLRNRLILSGPGYLSLVSRWSCLWTPWNVLYVWTDPMSGIMLLVVSMDRFFAVYSPIRYYKSTRVYPLSLVGGAYAFMLCNVLLAVALTHPYREPEYPALCITVMALHPGYYVYHTVLRVGSAVLSVLLYGIVMVVMRRKKPVKNGYVAPSQLSVQQRVTKTLGICCIFTTVFFVIPILIGQSTVFLGMDGTTLAYVLPYSFIVININPMLNIFIYSLRLKDMRMGLKCLLQCRQLTAGMLQRKSEQEASRRMAMRQPSLIIAQRLNPNQVSSVVPPHTAAAERLRKVSAISVNPASKLW